MNNINQYNSGNPFYRFKFFRKFIEKTETGDFENPYKCGVENPYRWVKTYIPQKTYQFTKEEKITSVALAAVSPDHSRNFIPFSKKLSEFTDHPMCEKDLNQSLVIKKIDSNIQKRTYESEDKRLNKTIYLAMVVFVFYLLYKKFFKDKKIDQIKSEINFKELCIINDQNNEKDLTSSKSAQVNSPNQESIKSIDKTPEQFSKTAHSPFIDSENGSLNKLSRESTTDLMEVEHLNSLSLLNTREMAPSVATQETNTHAFSPIIYENLDQDDNDSFILNSSIQNSQKVTAVNVTDSKSLIAFKANLSRIILKNETIAINKPPITNQEGIKTPTFYISEKAIKENATNDSPLTQSDAEDDHSNRGDEHLLDYFEEKSKNYSPSENSSVKSFMALSPSTASAKSEGELYPMDPMTPRSTASISPLQSRFYDYKDDF